MAGKAGLAAGLGALALLLTACGDDGPDPEEVAEAREEAAEFFEEAFWERTELSPIAMTWLGRKDDQDEWDSFTEDAAEDEKDLAEDQLEDLADLECGWLDEVGQMSCRLMKFDLEQVIEAYRWRDHRYPFNQMFGLQSLLPNTLNNAHKIATEDDAEAYVARLVATTEFAEETEAMLRRHAELGTLPPRFVFPLVIEQMEGILSGYPFDEEGEASSLWADFTAKVDDVEEEELDYEETEGLKEEARLAMQQHFGPAYRRLIAVLQELAPMSQEGDGAWRLPDGEAYYAYALRRNTGKDMTPEQVHQLGLQETARIHDEMRAIARRLGYPTRDLQRFFRAVQSNPRLVAPNTEEGRQQYLALAQRLIDDIDARQGELFLQAPKAALEVRPVEAWRERSTGKAFYERPAPDGSRPGVYYVNLYDMAEVPIYQAEALAYHEAVPGHHMQIALAQELEGMPMFRRMGGYTAYTEGWGLYSELLPKEYGFYQDPYSDFGRLAMELWRAARLVVDTGIHYKRWTREEAAAWLRANTPNSDGDIQRSVNRYAVMPGQATAYKVGMLEILDLRERAREALGPDFDIRVFHDWILGAGPLPLSILAERVEAKITEAVAARSAG